MSPEETLPVGDDFEQHLPEDEGVDIPAPESSGSEQSVSQESVPETRRSFLQRFNRWMLGMNAVVISAAVYKGCELMEQREALEKIKAKQEMLKAERERLREELRLLTGAMRPMPEQVANDPELREFFEKNFVVVAGNASVEDAKVICWCDFHFFWHKANKHLSFDEDRRIGFRCGNQIGRGLEKTLEDGDHVLLEGSEPGSALGRMHPMQLPMIYPGFITVYKKNFSLDGWDDKELLRQHSAAFERGDDRAILEILMKRDDVMYKNINESAGKQSGQIHVIAGSAHLDNDLRIDVAMEQAGLPYIILQTKEVDRIRRERGQK